MWKPQTHEDLKDWYGEWLYFMQLEDIKCHFPCAQRLCRGPLLLVCSSGVQWGSSRPSHIISESLLVILILTHLFTHLYVHISDPQAAEFLKKGIPPSSQSDRHPPWKTESLWQWECEETDKTELDFSEVRARSRHLLSTSTYPPLRNTAGELRG